MTAGREPLAAAAAFWRGVAQVLSGSVVAQAIPLLGYLVIARLYAPAEFGVFAAWLGAVTLAAVAMTGRYEMALAVEADGVPRRLGVLATLSVVWMASAVLALVAAVVWLVYPLPQAITPVMLGLMVLVTWLLAMVNTWQAWAAAEGAYRSLSWMRVAQALVVTLLQIVAGLLSPSATGMMIGQALGLACAVVIAAFLMPLGLSRGASSEMPWAAVRSYWSRHRRFPMLALPADAINSAAGQLPLLFIAARFGTEAGGLFALTLRVLGAPIGLIGNAILDVFKRSASASFRETGQCTEDYKRTFVVLAFGACALLVGVYAIADWVFVTAFGEAWRRAGTIAKWLVPLFAMRFVASPLSYVFYIAGKQQVDLAWQCVLLVMTVLAFNLPSGFQASVQFYALGYGMLYAVYAWLSYEFSKGKRA